MYFDQFLTWGTLNITEVHRKVVKVGSLVGIDSGYQHSSVLCDQKIIEDNHKLRPGCPPDYQMFCGRIEPKIFTSTNLLSYLSLTNKNGSMTTSTTYI